MTHSGLLLTFFLSCVTLPNKKSGLLSIGKTLCTQNAMSLSSSVSIIYISSQNYLHPWLLFHQVVRWFNFSKAITVGFYFGSGRWEQHSIILTWKSNLIYSSGPFSKLWQWEWPLKAPLSKANFCLYISTDITLWIGSIAILLRQGRKKSFDRQRRIMRTSWNSYNNLEAKFIYR